MVGGLPNDSVRGVSCGRRDPPKQNPALISQAEGERKELGVAHQLGAGHDAFIFILLRKLYYPMSKILNLNRICNRRMLFSKLPP